jgi:hypothetical protein
MLDNDIRASDAEREEAILRLHDACGEGRLSLDEFSDRAKAVYSSRTRAQLVPLTVDLPRTQGAASNQRATKRVTFSLLSDIKRKGRWRIDGETTAISVLGSCTLDLRKAIIQGHDVIINAYVLLGAVKIIVPPGIQVELEGFTILGTRDSKLDDEDVVPGAPIVRVRGLTVLGAVNVEEEDSHGLAKIAAR